MNISIHEASCLKHQNTDIHSISKQPYLLVFRKDVCRNPEATTAVTPKRRLPQPRSDNCRNPVATIGVTPLLF